MYKQVGDEWVLDIDLLELQKQSFLDYAHSAHGLSKEDLIYLDKNHSKIRDMMSWANYNYIMSAIKETK